MYSDGDTIGIMSSSYAKISINVYELDLEHARQEHYKDRLT